MRYGVPYKGSKNSIAEWIVAELPRADTFVDLFMGGGAVTHAALLSGKYKNFIINDIDGRMPKLFLDCIDGKYTPENHSEWISREEFFEKKDADAYIALIWSFGNNGKDYLYSKEIEPFKKAYHYAVFYGDYRLFEQQGINIPHSDKKSIYDRYTDTRRALLRLMKSDRGGVRTIRELHPITSE
jgi:site-specific DNA-adenine methylase